MHVYTVDHDFAGRNYRYRSVLASGASIANAGGALTAYGLIGLIVFFMMECLREMVCLLFEIKYKVLNPFLVGYLFTDLW